MAQDAQQELARRLSAMERLWTWAVARGADLARVRVEPGDHGLKLVASASVAAGEPIFVLPFATLWFEGDPPSADQGPGAPEVDAMAPVMDSLQLEDMVPDGDSGDVDGDRQLHVRRMAMQLVLETLRGERSPWSTYLATLPALYPTHPVAYGLEERAIWGGSDIAFRTGRMAHRIRAAAETLRRADSEMGPRLAERLPWACLSVESRIFTVRRGGVAQSAMVPILETCDHATDPNVSWKSSEDDTSLVVFARRDIAAGEELHDSYGAKGSGSLLLKYGFVMPDGRFDRATIQLVTPKNREQLYAAQARVGLRRTYDGRRAIPHFGHASAKELLGLLRVSTATEAELQRMALSHDAPDDLARFRAASAAHERRAMQMLVWACRGRLVCYATPYEEDMALLSNPRASLTTNMRNLRTVLAAEKRALMSFLALGETAIRVLDGAPVSDPGDAPVWRDLIGPYLATY